MKRRASGILLHVTSLPSRFGVGDLGAEAHRFLDFLSEAKQSFWQVLPLSPTTPGHGNSPYSSPSAFAGNPLLIAPDLLVEMGCLVSSDLAPPPAFPEERVDYPAVREYKEKLLEKAYRGFQKGPRPFLFDYFCHEHASWLEDYALFMALKEDLGIEDWSRWPAEIRDRKDLAPLREKFRERIEKEKFLQFLFFRQWTSLKKYGHAKGIQIIGDFPIYVDYESASVWAHPEIFQLGPEKRPAAVAGVPPDYFSSTGQLWGNPLYRWDVLKETGYSWWVERLLQNLKLVDLIRLDHFKGFAEYWEVPAGETTAVNGRWRPGPGADLFQTFLRHLPYLPLIAEDLGVITADVLALRDRFEMPGMRVLQFAFGNDPLAEEYKPYCYIPNCVAYTGTHDNDTLVSWLKGGEDYSTRKPVEVREERRNALAYLGRKALEKEIHWEFIRVMMMSAANLVVTPMQDVLGLGGEARMNRPGTAWGNWEWRLAPRLLTGEISEKLADMTARYGRA